VVNTLPTGIFIFFVGIQILEGEKFLRIFHQKYKNNNSQEVYGCVSEKTKTEIMALKKYKVRA
jgi:hypothetical protein